ncbi:MAG: SEC-C domain-containing protein [Thermoguttaceae bacterium]|nr:SEC-C domain-containing protein [Thermoguttaceae bacterium]
MSDTLANVWDAICDVCTGISRGIERSITSVFGSSNARYIKKLQPKVQAINDLEPKYAAMSDEELRNQTVLFRQRLDKGETLDDLLVEAFAVCREASKRVLGMRHFDVQLIGGMVLHSGAIAEMMTGEGKTLVATLPAYLNALEGRGVHVVTVNDYLARRDMEWMGKIYMFLGLTVGVIQSQMETSERQKAYDCDITYGTNNEFGFDYLRDNMRPAARGDWRYPKELQQSQGRLNYAIIDEVDNILIDEARTPLIISGGSNDDVKMYQEADRIARQLVKDVDYEVNEKDHTANMTDEGIRHAEKLAGVESFYTQDHMEWPHLIDNALKAHSLYKRDVNYIISDEGEIVIVDEFTGRLMPGRNWSDGLHQAVEAKEGVKVKQENQTLATVTLQNFFKLYRKISGMTGTAMTEAGEFWKIYKLDVIAIPTNKPIARINYPDQIYRTSREKYNAIVNEIERMNRWDSVSLKGSDEWIIGDIVKETDDQIELLAKGDKVPTVFDKSKVDAIERKGRPLLVGTTSVENSEKLSEMLSKRGIAHQVLNAKHHQREAEIIAQAGRKGAVTIATNMAGRGTDIILGGNAEAKAWSILQQKYASKLDVPQEEWKELEDKIEETDHMKEEGDEVRALGGLHVIGSERHEARRIDLQLRGRCGRQGDPGSSRFFLSLEDDLMRIFAGEWVKNILTRLGMQEGQAIESKMVSRRVEGAQKKVEERNFEVRKNLLEYDEVMDEQRKRTYGYRQNILDGADCRALILEMIDEQINNNIGRFLAKGYNEETFAAFASQELSVELDARSFRNMSYEDAEKYAKSEAYRLAESAVNDAIQENIPDDAEEDEWNWEALTRWVNTHWKTSLRERDLKDKKPEGQLDTFLVEKVRAAIDKVSLEPGRNLMDPYYGRKAALNWLKMKFDIVLDFEAVKNLEKDEFIDLVSSRAIAAYREKEVKFPVMAGLVHAVTYDAMGSKHYDRDAIIEWVDERFKLTITHDDLKNKQRHEIEEFLKDISRKELEKGDTVKAKALELAKAFIEKYGKSSSGKDIFSLDEKGRAALPELAAELKEKYDVDIKTDYLATVPLDEMERRILEFVEDRYRPEMRKLERALVLQIVDSSWKKHLMTMDHLRSSVGLRGYAQVDPKVEYKREGMRAFDEMWNGVGDQVTSVIYRMEQQVDDRFLGSVWKRQKQTAVHEQSGNTASSMAQGADIQRQQQQAIDNSQVSEKKEPIRRTEAKIGRNDPCPCGSGKKYKKCCGKDL